MILDVLPGGRDFRYRLIGTLVTQYFSADGTGRTVMEAFEPNGEAVAKSVNAVFRKVARDKVVMRTAGAPAGSPKGWKSSRRSICRCPTTARP